MMILNRFYFVLTLVLITLSILSCSKKEDAVELVVVDVDTFDSGHLLIKMENTPVYVDSMIYFNLTKGTSFKVDLSLLGYNQQSNLAILSMPLKNGNTNDLVECCVYLNNTVDIGIVFEDLYAKLDSNYLDSVITQNSGANSPFCFNGVY